MPWHLLPDPATREAAALALAEQLLALGATLVLLRRGAEGVLVAHGPSGEAFTVSGKPNEMPTQQ